MNRYKRHRRAPVFTVKGRVVVISLLFWVVIIWAGTCVRASMEDSSSTRSKGGNSSSARELIIASL